MRLFSILFFFLFSQLHIYAMSEAEQLISNGSGHNNYFLYEDAIIYLNKAIKQDPSIKRSYKERAISYFEMGKIDLALEDYNRVIERRFPNRQCNIDSPIPIVPCVLVDADSYLDFGKGLLQGTWLGSKEGTIEFISSIRGNFTFLWADLAPVLGPT